jgi:hypothetical protein
MAIEGELARAGIITTDDATIITKPLTVAEDVDVQGAASFGDDVSIDGDLLIYGDVSGTLAGKYNLQIHLHNGIGEAETGGYSVIPTGGDGYISRAYAVVHGDVGASGGELELNTEEGALDSDYDITIPDETTEGTVLETIAIPSSATNNSVAAGEAIWVDIDDACTNNVEATVVVEITRS